MEVTTRSGDVTSIPVRVNPGTSAGAPFATLDLGRHANLTLGSLADVDTLIIAATTAKRRLAVAIAGTPHEWVMAESEHGYTTHCDTCGTLKGNAVHDTPAEPPAAALERSIREGTPITVEDDEPEPAPAFEAADVAYQRTHPDPYAAQVTA